jgi:hypothetical protein
MQMLAGILMHDVLGATALLVALYYREGYAALAAGAAVSTVYASLAVRRLDAFRAKDVRRANAVQVKTLLCVYFATAYRPPKYKTQ